MGNNVPHPLEKNIDDIIAMLEKDKSMFATRGIDVTPSVKYLKRADVRKQATSICKRLNIDKVSTYCTSILGLAVVEIKATDVANKTYVLNFWPCDTCACVGVDETPVSKSPTFSSKM